jgi:DNA-binding transcriptional ArsR family regulator
MRALDRREARVEQLAEELGEPPRAIAAHLRVLCRAGIVCRTDRHGPAVYRLADWPSLWLVDQLARRLRERTTGLDDATDRRREQAAGGGPEGAWR